MVEIDGIEFTDSQKEALDALRDKLSKFVNKELYEDTYLLYRYLKVCSFHVNNAENMIIKTLQWRKQFKMDTILDDYDPPEVMKMLFGNTIFAKDKNGTPFHYYPTGKLDTKGILSSCREIDILKTVAQKTERDEQYLKKNRKTPNGSYPGYLIIYDFEGLEFSQATDKKAIETTIRVLTMYQNYYPLRLHTIYLINASNLFYLPYNIAKTFFDSDMLKTLRIFGTRNFEWKEELSKMVEADQLPVFLGGKRTDPDGDPLCKTIMAPAFKVDEKYYLPKSKKELSTHPDAKKLVLSRASFLEIEVDVLEPGSLIEWEFETKTRDIGFGLFHKKMVDGEEKITELVPLLRLDTEAYAETGFYQCENAGTHVILFDNSYSWIRSKEIYYRTKIISPKDHEKELKD